MTIKTKSGSVEKTLLHLGGVSFQLFFWENRMFFEESDKALDTNSSFVKGTWR
jgi:hypothetical protein